MLKGKAKIELTNVKTGEKETYESENMITNFFNDLFTPDPYASFLSAINQKYKDNTYSSQNDALASVIQQLTKGLVLWDNTLEENADKYHSYDHDALAVGVANNIVYSGNITTRGSYNQKESSILLSSPFPKSGEQIKYVWDFDTSHGIGTIKSISLCPPINTYFMPALENLQSEQYAYNENYGELYRTIITDNMNKYLLYQFYNSIDRLHLRSYIKDNIEYTIDINKLFVERKLLIQSRTIKGQYNFLINGLYDKFNQAYMNDSWKTIQELEIPSELENVILNEKQDAKYSTAFFNFASNGKLRILFFPNYQDYISSTDTVYIWEINIFDNYSSKVLTFNNIIPDGYYITTMNYNISPMDLISNNAYTNDWRLACNNLYCFTDNYLYFEAIQWNDINSYYYNPEQTLHTNAKNIKLMILNLNTGECKEIYDNSTDINPIYGIKMFDQAYINNSSFGFDAYCLRKITTYKDNLYFCTNSNKTDCGISCTRNKFINGYYRNEAIDDRNTPMLTKNGLIIDRDFNYAMVNPFSFCTINNLETPITKGNDQVMKITYTLTVD